MAEPAETLTGNTCEELGKPEQDISGIQILLALAIQAALSILLSLASSIWLKQLLKINGVDQYTELPKTFPDSKSRRLKRKLDLASKLLLKIGEIQNINGVALMLSCWFQWKTLSLYNWSIVYNTVNFSSLSTAFATWTARTAKHEKRYTKRPSTWGSSNLMQSIKKLSRFSSVSYLYICFVVLYGIRLGRWGENENGYCYKTDHTSTASASHPGADETFLGITAAFYCLFLALSSGMFFSRRYQSTIYLLLGLGTLQFAVHMWMVFALRAGNEPYFEENSENEWAFGQTVAIVTLVSVAIEMVGTVRTYLEWRRHHMHRPPPGYGPPEVEYEME